jgi:transposase-like protein
MVTPSLPDTEVYLGQIERIRTAISKLDATQLIDISHFIKDILEGEATSVQMEARSTRLKDGACVHCGVIGRSQKWGKSKSGTQRFKCGSCGKTYSAMSGTPVYRLRFRNEWNRYLTLMRSHVAIRTLRDEHGFKHHADTLLRWRHRFLAFLSPNPDQQLAGLIEADEKFFRTSYKGTHAWKRGHQIDGRAPRRRGGANQR